MVQKHCISPLIGSNKRKERGLLGISKKSSPHSKKLGLTVSGPSLRLASVALHEELQGELEPVIGQVCPRLGGQLLKELNQLERVLDQVRSQSLNLALGQLRRYPTQATTVSPFPTCLPPKGYAR